MYTALSLEQLLLNASYGEKGAIEEFFRALLKAELIVPERMQHAPQKDSPKYPNPFFNFLGVPDGDHVVVPVFTQAEHLEFWAGQKLNFKTIAFTKIIETLPQNWWLILNPGQDAEKEFSAWEVQTFRGGEAAIEELVNENIVSDLEAPFELVELTPDQVLPLRTKIKDWAVNKSQVSSLRIAREKGQDHQGNVYQRLLIGLEINASHLKDLENLRSELQALVDLHQIGDKSAKVVAGVSGHESLSLQAILHVEPFWTASKS